MHIAFCTPFKPLDHPKTSGDVTIARDIHDFFLEAGHNVSLPPQLSTEWLWQRPTQWFKAYHTIQKAKKQAADSNAWSACFTYHSYYRAPDLIGPALKKQGIPYFIFAPSYSPKRFKSLKTLPGARLNQKALYAADHLFVNKMRDALHLPKDLPRDRISFIRPGIRTRRFQYDPNAREILRREWQIEDTPDSVPVVLTVASLRSGVKADGVTRVIKACAALRATGKAVKLIVAGDGPEAEPLQRMATEALGDDVCFLGFVDRWSLYRVYSAADVFAFPGINEGLGMVYLEAQSCGLPVVAWDHDGAPEVIHHNETGLVTPSWDMDAFASAINSFLESLPRRKVMGTTGAAHVRQHHDLYTNYATMEKTMQQIIENNKRKTAQTV